MIYWQYVLPPFGFIMFFIAGAFFFGQVWKTINLILLKKYGVNFENDKN